MKLNKNVQNDVFWSFNVKQLFSDHDLTMVKISREHKYEYSEQTHYIYFSR